MSFRPVSEKERLQFEAVASRVWRTKELQQAHALPKSEKAWRRLSASQLIELEAHIFHVQEETKTIGHEEHIVALNADSRFLQHLEIMRLYWNEMLREPAFQRFLKRAGVTPEFLESLVFMHDFGRFVFNGLLPLQFIDNVSDGLVRHHFPEFPRAYLHSMKWLTGEKEIPSLQGSQAEQIALALKAIDTLGKLDAQGELMDPQNFFATNGAYHSWLVRQVENQRLPFVARGALDSGEVGRTLIQPEVYAVNDQAATLRGVQAIEQLCGQSFSQVRARVGEHLVQKHQTTR